MIRWTHNQWHKLSTTKRLAIFLGFHLTVFGTIYFCSNFTVRVSSFIFMLVVGMIRIIGEVTSE